MWMWSEFADGREVLGVGSIAWDNGTPYVHVHTVAGREDKRRVVVHFDGPLDPEARHALASRGAH